MTEDTETYQETASTQAERFLCHLFLCPRIAKRIVRQWMYQYVPSPVETGAPRPRYDTPGSWVGAMVARTLLMPTDLEMTGFYNMTKSTNMVHGSPQYILSAWTPTNDYTYSIPFTRLFEADHGLYKVKPKFIAENMCRLAMFLNPEHHWHTRVDEVSMHGHAYFGQFKHMELMRAMYFPLMYALEILYYYVKKMTCSRHWSIPEDLRPAACDLVLDMIKPLKDYDRSEVAVDQHAYIDSCYKLLLEQVLSRNLLACYEKIKSIRRVIQEHVRGLYLAKSGLLNKSIRPVDSRVLLTLKD